MKLESDSVEVMSGVRRGVSLGSPIALELENRDCRIDSAPAVQRPRPGHADLAGSLKWLTTDCRATLERASARETAARVAAGALTGCLLREFGIEVLGYVVRIEEVEASSAADVELDELRRRRDANEVYCPDVPAAERMIEAIRQAHAGPTTPWGAWSRCRCGVSRRVWEAACAGRTASTGGCCRPSARFRRSRARRSDWGLSAASGAGARCMTRLTSIQVSGSRLAWASRGVRTMRAVWKGV